MDPQNQLAFDDQAELLVVHQLDLLAQLEKQIRVRGRPLFAPFAFGIRIGSATKKNRFCSAFERLTAIAGF